MYKIIRIAVKTNEITDLIEILSFSIKSDSDKLKINLKFDIILKISRI